MAEVDKNATAKAVADKKAADEAAEKIAKDAEAAQKVTRAAAGAPHPSEDKPSPTSDQAVEEARARALADDDDEDVDLDAVSNLGPEVGKPIQCIVRKKFFSDNQEVVVPGQTYYLQMREGQTFPSDVLEPVDPKLSKKFRREFRDKQADRRYREVERQNRLDQFLGVADAARAS